MSKPETELCFYGLVTKPEGYEQAVDFEDHEQWEFTPPHSGEGRPPRQRVRKTSREDGVRFDQTIKTPTGSATVEHGNEEETVQITESFFEAWKLAFPERGLFKRRYVYLTKNITVSHAGKSVVLPELKYEVDVFTNPQGQRSAWVKIDVELDNILPILKQEFPDMGKIDIKISFDNLPLGLTDVFAAVNLDDAHKAALDAFWKAFTHKGKAVQ